MDDREALQKRVATLEKELASAQQKTAELNQKVAELQRDRRASEVADGVVSITEFEDTLKRLVQRVAMILQAEKCAIMTLNREEGVLVARPPAFGMADEDLASLRAGLDNGIPGQVFRSGEPTIFHDAASDPRANNGSFAKLKIRNGVIVPLIVEKRDEDNRVLDRIAIGTLNVFNKRYAGDFIDEDVRLLDRLARSVAAVIANAQVFQELVEQKEKLAHTIEDLYAGLILIGGNGKVMQMNARAREIFNITNDPAGRPYGEVLKHERTVQILDRMLAAQEPAPPTGDEEEGKGAEEISVPDPETDEDRIYQVHPAPVRDENRGLIGTVIILNDITDIRNLERMKTEFVAIAAHELRTPMTPIKGFISMLAQDEFDSFGFEERKEYYQIIEQNVDRLGRLINDLLNVTRIERGVNLQLFWEEVDLAALSEAVFEIQRGMTNTDRHSLVLDADPNPLTATVGKDQMEQILQNLVSNAIKYSPEGGEVRIILRLESDTDTVLCGVRDQGTGIPESARPKLFKRYTRIHNEKTRSVKGTGIGLFLVKELVQAHGGTIWFDSEMDKGTTFWFRIPRKPTDDAAPVQSVD